MLVEIANGPGQIRNSGVLIRRLGATGYELQLLHTIDLRDRRQNKHRKLAYLRCHRQNISTPYLVKRLV